MLYLHNNYTVVEDLKQLSERLDSSSHEASKTEKNILRRVFSSTIKNRLGEKEIISNLKVIEQQDSITKERLMKREARLAVTSSEIKEQFYDLITKLENEISGFINEKAQAADKLAGQTYISSGDVFSFRNPARDCGNANYNQICQKNPGLPGCPSEF